MTDEQTALTQAVTQLTSAVKSLDSLLRDEYPKRSEVERKFVSKLQNQKIVTKIIIVALITVLGCYIVTVGSYSQCFVGEESPSVCKYVPGYEERIERKDEVNSKFEELEKKITKLRKRGVRNDG